MFKTINIILFTFFFYTIHGQNDSIVLNKPICADLDLKGNIYFIDSSYEICKRTAGVVTNRFSLTNYGEGPIIDASNPLEVFVFYENSGILLVLDNNLNPVQELNLYTSNNLRVQAFGRSNDGKVWIFDANSSTLRKYDRTAALVAESIILNKGAQPTTKGIVKILDNGSFVAFQQNKEFTVIMNNNLKVVLNKQDSNKLVGLTSSAYLEQHNNTLIMKNIHSGKQDEQIIMADTEGEIVCALNGKVLVLKGQKLILKTY